MLKIEKLELFNELIAVTIYSNVTIIDHNLIEAFLVKNKFYGIEHSTYLLEASFLLETACR
jgi:hypothetical protein